MTTARRASSSPTCRSRTCRAAPTSSSAPSASQHPQLAGRRLSADDPTIPLRHVRDGRAGAALRRLSERPFREQRCGGRSARRYAGVDASGRDSHRRLSAEIAPRSVSRGSHPAGGRDRSTAWRALLPAAGDSRQRPAERAPAERLAQIAQARVLERRGITRYPVSATAGSVTRRGAIAAIECLLSRALGVGTEIRASTRPWSPAGLARRLAARLRPARHVVHRTSRPWGRRSVGTS